MRFTVPRLRDMARLVRLSVSAMVAVSAAFGFMLEHPVPDVRLVLVCLGTFMLAAACSVWNQVQERDTDAMLSRTADRPVPAGTVTSPSAMLMGTVLALLAAGCLMLVSSTLVWLGAGIVLVYNGLYTPLKRRTGLALLVGAVPGAMPPVMGWIAAGGSMADPAIVAVYTVYYLWQVPHFWLRVERDMHEYARAGLPLPAISFGAHRYGVLLRLWFHAYAVGLLMLPLFAVLHSSNIPTVSVLLPVSRVLLTAGAMVLFLVPGGLLLYKGCHARAFHWVNASLLAVMVLLLADRMLLAYQMV